MDIILGIIQPGSVYVTGDPVFTLNGLGSDLVESVLMWQQPCQKWWVFVGVWAQIMSLCLLLWAHLSWWWLSVVQCAPWTPLQHFPFFFLSCFNSSSLLSSLILHPFHLFYNWRPSNSGGLIECKWRVIIDLISSRTTHLAVYGAHSLPACTTFSLSSFLFSYVWLYLVLFLIWFFSRYFFSPIFHFYHFFLFSFFFFFLFDFSCPPLPCTID